MVHGQSELQDIALCIFKNCVQHNMFIDVEWVPRTDNDKADYISRIIDYDHWECCLRNIYILSPCGDLTK